MKKITYAVIAATALLASFNSAASGDAAAGKAKAGMCAGCHGPNGKALIPTYPNLAGQNAPYIVSALKAYKDKTRTGGQAAVMHATAAALSDADMANLAAFFASQK